MTNVVLSLGSNIEPRKDHLDRAVSQIRAWSGKKLRLSNIYITEPYGYNSAHEYLNMAVELDTDLTPEEIMHRISALESEMGRHRTDGKIEDRTIDIDLLFYGGEIIHEKDLDVPHPRLHQRNFVLTPLLDIVPDLFHPELKKPVWELYDECKDRGEVCILE